MEGIVVGVDGSDGSRVALRWAFTEGQLRKESVTALMTWRWMGPPHVGDGVADIDSDAAALHHLERFVTETVGEDSGVQLHVVCDTAPNALLDASERASLLVVGARGHGLVKRTLLGSVSASCLHYARCPVAVVRTEPNPAATNRVVVGIDGSDESLRAMRWAADEAMARNAALEVVHVWSYPVMADVGPVGVDPQLLASAAESVIDKAIATIDETAITRGVTRSVVQGSAAKALIDRSEDAVLTVVGSRGHGGFAGLLLGSVSQQLANHLRSPLVVVR